MKDKCKVSVIIPVYNTEKYLKKCLDSLVNQTLDDFEIIIVDDGSTDSSPKIIDEYKQKYFEFVKVISKENGGQATARNVGIMESSGEYIGFVDSDDEVDVNMFEAMYNKAKQNSLDYVECDYRYVECKKNGMIVELPTYGTVKAHNEKKDLFIDPLVSPWNKLYKASLIKDNNIIFPEGFIYEDTSFFLKTIVHIEKYGYVDEKFVIHYLRDNSTMSINKSIKVADIFPVLTDAIDYYKKSGNYEKYREELEYVCVKILLCSSLKRIASVKDRNIRNNQIDMTLEFINNNFSGYRKNKYFAKGIKNTYMKHITNKNIRIICDLMKLL